MWKTHKRDQGFTLIELLIVVAIIGILAAMGIPNLLTAMQRAKQKRTMSDMRNLSIAWEARATEVNSFAGAAQSFEWPAEDMTYADLDSILKPTYIRTLPEKDGWGHFYDFATEEPIGSDVRTDVYGVRSRGRDGKLDSELTHGGTTNFSCDIVYSNGSFVAYPEGVNIN